MFLYFTVTGLALDAERVFTAEGDGTQSQSCEMFLVVQYSLKFQAGDETVTDNPSGFRTSNGAALTFNV